MDSIKTDKNWPPLAGGVPLDKEVQDALRSANGEPPPATCEPVGVRALKVALSHLGEREEGGPNMGPPVDWSVGRWTRRKPDDTGWAEWCAGFVSTCFLEAQATDWQRVGSLSVDHLWQRCLERGWVVQASSEVLQPGDIVFFTHGGDENNAAGLRHVGIVERVEGRVLYTVEGNAGNQVRRRTYDLSNPQIYGFARVP